MIVPAESWNDGNFGSVFVVVFATQRQKAIWDSIHTQIYKIAVGFIPDLLE